MGRTAFFTNVSVITKTDCGNVPDYRRLRKHVATHSRILAWKIPWTGKPGRLQSMGSDMTEHTLTHTQT